MSKRPKNRSARSKQQAHQRASRAARVADYPLRRLMPPFEFYKEWIAVPDAAKDVVEYPLSAEDAAALTDGAKDLLNTCIKLGPRYKNFVPMAAIHLDQQLRDGVITLAVTGEPGRCLRVPLAELAASVSDPQAFRDAPEDVQRLVMSSDHPGFMTEDACAWHFHELHVRGYLIVDDDAVINMAIPPKTAGGHWWLNGHESADD